MTFIFADSPCPIDAMVFEEKKYIFFLEKCSLRCIFYEFYNNVYPYFSISEI